MRLPRLPCVVRRRDREQRLDEEIRFHVDFHGGTISRALNAAAAEIPRLFDR